MKKVGSLPGTLSFRYNGVNIGLNSNAADIIAALGSPNDVFEAPSCAFEGVDKFLYYNGFVINTYPKNGQDNVLSIILNGAQTPEGLGIGMSVDDMVAIYGENYYGSAGAYVYSVKNVELTVLTEGSSVVEISYYYTAAAS
ncbi:MAG: hypothetical protein LBU32_00625 [Clostridiales bacterium]|nr:hypothetical protein [Clostridiales bacterium]